MQGKILINGAAVMESLDHKAYTQARLLSDITDTQKAHIMDIAQDYNMHEVCELIRLKTTELSEMLAAYLHRPVRPCAEATNIKNGQRNYVLDLLLPHGFQKEAMESITEHAHMYVVYSVLGEWIGMAVPKMIEWYEGKARSEYEHIAKAAKSRVGSNKIVSDII